MRINLKNLNKTVVDKLVSNSLNSYKSTILLGRTKFRNRTSHEIVVNDILPRCTDEVYKEQLNKFLMSKNHEIAREQLFVIHDGPPYANGPLHLGHALNKVLKDIINRFQLINGKHIFFKVGWDCHGLPIELKALRGSQDRDMSPKTIRSAAKRHAELAIETQRNEFRTFGIMTDWHNPYLTMNSRYEIQQLDIFLKMFRHGIIRRQRKPVYWGTETRTALAEGELEYDDKHVSTAVFVKFPLSRGALLDLYRGREARSIENIHLLIWTSTPWTLFANRAIAYNEELRYSVIRLTDDPENLYIVESNLVKKLHLIGEFELIDEFNGSMLMNCTYRNLLTESNVERPLIHGSHVNNMFGTGLVHTAPGHGQEDYKACLKYKLEIYSPVDDMGRYNLAELPNDVRDLLTDPETGFGRKVMDKTTTEVIVNRLKELGILFHVEEYTHSYPYDWRSKKPIIIRSTYQWFADLNNAKNLATESLKNVDFYPARGKARLNAFIQNRDEWCISRQRVWGVPIPAFHKVSDPNIVLMNEETINHVRDVIERRGIEAWFDEDNTDIYEWLPCKYHDKAHEYVRGTDTMDVWFDSGTSWNVIEHFFNDELKMRPPPGVLADLYLEGSDQHRGWFQSSLLTYVASKGQAVAPYKAVLTHGFLLDENGIKMSKSIGNTISPSEIIKGDPKNKDSISLGVDGLRYLIAQSDYTRDVTAGPVIFRHVAENLKKIRLTFKFLLSNLELHESPFSLVSTSQLRRIDLYTIAQLEKLSRDVTQHFADYNFSKGLTILQYHLNNNLSSLYFDACKDTLYLDRLGSLKRRQIQTVLFHILNTYRALLTPIIPVMVQEVWDNLPNDIKVLLPSTSPSLVPIPEYKNYPTDIIESFEANELKILKHFKCLFAKHTKDLGVTKPEEVQSRINISKHHEIPCTAEELEDILKVSKVDINYMENVSHGTEFEMQIFTMASLHKCPRCWKCSSTEPEVLCERCQMVVA